MESHNNELVFNERPLSPWVQSMRPRTLPLAISSIMTGSFLAISGGRYHWATILFALVTGVLLQILSNFANDYGDSVKGTDNEHRAGPRRALQSGQINHAQMRGAIVVLVVVCLLSGGALVYLSFGDRIGLVLVFLALGIAAIGASIQYTVGANAYGYKGLGDLFVFVFFGIIAVAGTWFLNTLRWQWDILLPAAAIGFLSTGVLNLNNMRDIDNDRASGKKTVAALLGYGYARVYHCLLIGGAFVLVALFVFTHYRGVWSLSFVLALPLFARDLISILRTADNQKLDPFLKRLSLSNLLFTALFGLGVLC